MSRNLATTLTGEITQGDNPAILSEPLILTHLSGSVQIMLSSLPKLVVFCPPTKYQAHVVQSIVSLTSSLSGQLVMRFTTLLSNTVIFLVEKIREAFALQKLLKAFALQKLLTFFQQKIMAYFRY